MLQDVKSYLNITYADECTDNMLESAIKRGKKILNDYGGTELDYEEEGLPRQLLFDYCRYVRSHAEEMFEQNFMHDLIALREMEEVRQYAHQVSTSLPNV